MRLLFIPICTLLFVEQHLRISVKKTVLSNPERIEKNAHAELVLREHSFVYSVIQPIYISILY